MNRTSLTLSVAGTAALLSACTTKPLPPPPEAVVTVTGKTCVEKPDLASAITLTPKKKQQWLDLTTAVNAATACLNVGDKKANYVVYSLPASPANHTLSIGGVYESLRILGPLVFVLNGQGDVVRSFTADRFANVGATYGVQFRPSDEARYILVQTNPNSAGIEVKAFETQLLASTNYAYNPATYGGSSYTTYSGREGATVRRFSHEGTVSVRIQAVTGKIGLPNEK